MSTGITHQKITTALVIPTAVCTWAVTGDFLMGAIAGAGCSFNVICGPDLDIDHITQNEAALLKMFRPLGWVWVAIWWPYAKMIPHRSSLSHWPILGTVIRDVYLLALIYAVAFLFGLETAVVDFIGTNTYFILAFVLGQICADSAHYVADIVSTKATRVFK